MMGFAVLLQHFTLDRALELLRRRADEGLLTGAAIIRDAAKDNVETHHFHGTAADATEVGRLELGDEIDTVDVGVLDLSNAPHARALEYGWKSETGMQPPVEPIAEWALERGIVDDDKSARSFGFAVARKIATEGFSFDKLSWLGDAATASIPAVEAAVVDAAKG